MFDEMDNATDQIFANLNPEQVEAVKCLEGPLLIMAGAGSGKTRVLTCRMANLLAHGVPAWNILAITFTNKAAKEMKTRAENMIGEAAQDVWISTFHSFCARMLRREIEVTGLYRRNFVIYDSSDSLSLLKSCIKELNLAPEKFSSMQSVISNAKNNLMDAEHYRESVFNRPAYAEPPSAYAISQVKIFELYSKRLLENNALDFDDLIFMMVKILREHEDIREKYQNKYKYILIDEYQDTNMAQYMLTKYLAEKYKNICVVGDADQSIYGWRGADMRNILNFEEDYPNATVIKLEQNYRSTKQILNLANAIIRKNIYRKEKNLWTNNAEGQKVQSIRCLSDKSEAAYVAREIKRLVAKKNVRYEEIAILYRTNSQSRILEERFIQAEIPYRIIGGLKFYDRKEVKDILAYLRLIYNPRDNVSLLRIINVPRRGIGPVNIRRIFDFAEEKNISAFELIANSYLLQKVPQISPKIKQALHDFAAMIISFAESQKNTPLRDLIQAVLDDSGYMKSLTDNETGDAVENLARIENLGEFLNSAAEFSEINQEATLENFLNHVTLITDADTKDKDEESRVLMMTIHSAKGLEFPVVFVTGLEDGLLPHANSFLEPEMMEEERRAFYVAVTRAQKLLYLTSACERKNFGKVYPASSSRFIKELPETLLEIVSERNPLGSEQKRISQAMIGIAPQNYPHRKVYSAPTANKEAKITTLSNKPKEKIDWKVGDQAKHRKWGLGTVMAVDDDLLKIVFANPEIGEKNLRASIAPIEKA